MVRRKLYPGSNKPSDQLVGLCGFHPDLWSPQWKTIFWPTLFGDGVGLYGQASLELGVGYALAHAARGYGYATEAVSALLNHAFQTLHINRIFAITDQGNVDSAKVMQRAGMRGAHNPDEQTSYPGIVE